MRIIFIGALIGGRKNLEALVEAGFRPEAAFTLDDSFSQASCYEPFDPVAERLGLRLFKVKNINDPAHVDQIRELRPDLIVVMSFSQMIKRPILEIPTIGTMGMHPTLLPKHRGRAPIPWALINGLDRTGVTIFFYNERVDAGPIVCQEEIPITDQDTAMTLGQKVDEACIRQLVKAVRSIADGSARPVQQDDSQATFWPKRNPEDGIVDWSKSTRDLYNWIRGLTHPYPGAFSFYRGEKVLIWSARQIQGDPGAPAGTVVRTDPGGMHVATVDGRLALDRLQPASGQELDASSFISRYGVEPGTRFGT